MTADHAQLRALAAAAGSEGWYEVRDIGCVLDCGKKMDEEFVIAASPTVVLELLDQLQTATDEANYYRNLAGQLRKQQIQDDATNNTPHSISHRAVMLMHDAHNSGLRVSMDDSSVVVSEIPAGGAV